ncbi:MAG TPA: pyruvate dehydrogenase (acetyl-transferring) E1 component subunit alpha [Tepidiformaceae bacterium]|nr:pyruvate dehydrogenase (acetyl-transferring) E1 component subunit alpha [Tepidiformaceae bacterium]
MTHQQISLPAFNPPEPGNEQLGMFLYQMQLLRRFEEKTGEMYTKGKIRGFLHLYTGQEACAVGALNALREQDRIVTHYRDHGHALARGVDANRIMAELFGRVDGVSGGRGGSMHLYDVSKGFLGGYAIVAAHLPLAVGLGLAAKMQNEDRVALCIFGDGSVGEGEFHEALNLSVLWKTPVIFFCENNLYGMGVRFAESLSTQIPTLAAAYNMPAVSINGMDVLEVYRETQKAVQYCSTGNGPYFIEAMTYRYRGHSMADPELYRLKDEIEQYRKRDAIEALKQHMMERGMLDEGGWQDVVSRVDHAVDEAVAFADASPEPGLDTLYDRLMAEPANG